jgi:hypothetical protein
MRKFMVVATMFGGLGAMWLSWLAFQAYATEGVYVLTGTTEPVSIPSQTRPADVSDIHNPMMTAVKGEAIITIPEDGWITEFSQSVQGAPESALRYTFVHDTSQQDPYCPTWKRVMFVMSVEKVPVAMFPPDHGYFVRKGTTIWVTTGFANFTDTPYENVRVAVDLSFVPRSSHKTLRDVYPFFLNAECKSIYAVPPRSTLTKELDKPFIVPMDGKMTLLASHAHRYAKSMLLELNGKELWRTTPVHLSDGTNLGNPIFITPFNGVPVKEGDTLEWTVTYENPLDRPSDAMSSIYIHIVPDEERASVSH